MLFRSDRANKQYAWVFKLVSEFGLFLSVIISVGYFHHWLIAAEEHEESKRTMRESLVKYVDGILLNSVKRGFAGITDKGLDFGEIMHGLSPGDYVYWQITFDPRFKHQYKDMENAINSGVHFRMIILKPECVVGELRSREITGFGRQEFHDYAKLFKISLEDVAARIEKTAAGSLGVFVSEGLPSVPLFIVIRKKSEKVEIYSSFYLSAPIPSMPYLNWESELKYGSRDGVESESWSFGDLFLEYFEKRWALEREKFAAPTASEPAKSDDFIYAPASARQFCSKLCQQ